MAQITTAETPPGADDAERLARYAGAPIPVHPQRHGGHRIVRFYRSAVGKKWAMAVSGLGLMLFVLVHMIGNLKMYLGPGQYNEYGEWLRDLGEPAAPRTFVLWCVRLGLVVFFAVHVHSAYSLTRMNRRARPVRYQSRRDYVAANFASRTMRWTGVIVGLFLLFHLMDLTWGRGGADFKGGNVYFNVVESFSRWPIAMVYVVANVALGLHLFHGAWSLFQSLGINNPSYNQARRWFAGGFAGIVTLGNVLFPLMVLAGVVSLPGQGA